MIVLGEAMGLVADVLQQPQGVGVATQTVMSGVPPSSYRPATFNPQEQPHAVCLAALAVRMRTTEGPPAREAASRAWKSASKVTTAA